jgi:thiol:disulfide interchange protein DsbD
MLVFFAFSFLGMYEIVLPNSWVNNADKQADKGGYYGIFFMAFTLALVSFSCTGPLVGLILVEAAGGMIVKPILGMFAFSLAIALPFSLFAAFPSWLNSLPKSGGWLNSVKVVLGFLELALAFKFLSIADQVYHWGILDRDIFLSIWIVIFGMIGFYLLGSIRLPHDSPVDKISVPRAALAIVSLAFVVYMVPGLFGAPLKQLSGYIPPQSSLDFDLVTDSEVEMIVAKKLKNSGLTLASQSDGKGIAQAVDFSEVKHANFLKLPHGLEGFFDYQQGVAYAKQVNKPIFIDFTGHGCVNCREMEARVWSDEEVLKRLQEEYVVIALYVDDRKTLPENEWYKSEYDQKVKKTIGQQNADLQIVKFNNNAQPFYTLLDHSGTLLVKPEAYNLNIQNFVDFLDIGVKNFQEKKNIATR